MSKPREEAPTPTSAGFESTTRTTPMGIEPEPKKKKTTRRTKTSEPTEE